MGTRHLTIIKDGAKILAQYGQWDGYPSGAGVEILKFIQGLDREALLTLRAQFAKTASLSEDEIKARWKAAGAGTSTWVDQKVSAEFKKKNPHLHRDLGAGILAHLMKAETPEMQDQIEFAASSLFCEWAYLLDLEAAKLIVFKGFNRRRLPKTAFFKYMEALLQEPPEEWDQYYPVREVGEVTFADCVKLTPEDFCAKFDPDTEE